MTSPKAVLKSVGPKLVPFFKTTCIYFVLFIPDTNPSPLAVIVKCLPIVSLIVFVLLHGMNLSDEYAYSRRILTGLIFACLGDAVLVYNEYFLYGMILFGIAQVVYATAFGMRPFNPYAATVITILASVVQSQLWPVTEGIYAVAVPIYVVLIAFMAWRGIARVQLFDDLWTWTKLCSCGGAVLFCISDLLIAVDHFVCPVPYSQALIMATYYAAQVGIALSVVDSRAAVEELIPPESLACSRSSSACSSGASSLNNSPKTSRSNSLERKVRDIEHLQSNVLKSDHNGLLLTSHSLD